MAIKYDIDQGGKEFHKMIDNTNRDVFVFFPILLGTILFAGGFINIWQQLIGTLITGLLLFWRISRESKG